MVTFSPAILPFFSRMVKQIEQRLGGVLVGAVAGVDDAGVEKARQKMRRAAGAVAHDDDVGVEGFEVAGGVLEGFAFFERGGLGGEIDDVGGEALGGQFEADARAGGRLDEEVDDGFAAQGGDFFDGALADGLEGAGGVEHGHDFLGGEGFDVEQMFAVPGHGVRSFRSVTSSSPPSSRKRTSMRSSSGGGDIFADEIGLDRQFAVAAVNQHGQLDAARAGRNRSGRPSRRGWCGR